MTAVELYLEDAYTRSCDTRVSGVDARGIQLERTPFYAQGGGQPGDRGALILRHGRRIEIVATLRDRDTGQVIQVPAAERVEVAIEGS